MKLIFGLGNPGKKYEGTRHNMGFMTLDKLADKHGIAVNEGRLKGLSGSGVIEGEKVFLIKPQTFMNLSGECVRAYMDYYKLTPDDIIIIYDDIDLDPGQIRIRARGSAGSHNGMKSVIKHMGVQEFPRVRVGVGHKPENWDLADYVLSHFEGEDAKAIGEGINKAAEAVEDILGKGIDDAMNKYNKKPKTEEEPKEKPETESESKTTA